MKETILAVIIGICLYKIGAHIWNFIIDILKMINNKAL